MKPSCPLTLSAKTKLDPDMLAWCEQHRDLRVCGDCVVVRGEVEVKVDVPVKCEQGRLW